jgi:hypothetical protein
MEHEIQSLTDEALQEAVATTPADHRGEVELRQAIELSFVPTDLVTLRFDPGSVDRADALEVFRRFRDEPASSRIALTDAVFEKYCKEIADGAGNFDTPQEQLDWEADFTGDFVQPRHATSAEDVWPLVRFDLLILGRGHSSGSLEVVLGGRGAWDGEHGIVLVFDPQVHLLRVGDWGHH